MTDHHSYAHNLSSCEIKAWKKFRPEWGSNPRPLWYRYSALPILSYQANWELATLWVYNIPVEGEEYQWIYSFILFELPRMIWRYDWSSQLCTQLKQYCCEIKAWKKFRPERDLNMKFHTFTCIKCSYLIFYLGSFDLHAGTVCVEFFELVYLSARSELFYMWNYFSCLLTTILFAWGWRWCPWVQRGACSDIESREHLFHIKNEIIILLN